MSEDKLVRVRLRGRGKAYDFSTNGLDLNKRDVVIVETVQGVEIGVVTAISVLIEDYEGNEERTLRPVLRLATEEDLAQYDANLNEEDRAFEIAMERIEANGLDMSLVDVEFRFDNKKITFFFTANGRVDFRDLVKDLAAIFRRRIELRQIGVRDNPGGLWGGRTVDNLTEGVSESRNPTLKALMMRATDADGRAIAESQGSGIRRMIAVLASKGMAQPQFNAQIGRFTVVIHRFGLLNPETQRWLKDYVGGAADAVNPNQQIALVLAKDMGVVTAHNLRNQLGIDSDDARIELNALVNQGLLEIVSTSGPGSERYGLVLFADHPDLTERQREILQLLSPTDARTVRQLSERIDMSVGALRNHLRGLVDAGLIIPTAPPSSRNRAYLLAKSAANERAT